MEKLCQFSIRARKTHTFSTLGILFKIFKLNNRSNRPVLMYVNVLVSEYIGFVHGPSFGWFCSNPMFILPVPLSLSLSRSLSQRYRSPSQNNVRCDEMGGGTKEGRSPGCWHNVPGLMRKCPKEGPIPMITYSICKYSRPQHPYSGLCLSELIRKHFQPEGNVFGYLFKYCLFPSLFIWRGSRINVCTTVESGVLCTFNFCSLSNTKVCLNL